MSKEFTLCKCPIPNSSTNLDHRPVLARALNFPETSGQFHQLAFMQLLPAQALWCSTSVSATHSCSGQFNYLELIVHFTLHSLYCTLYSVTQKEQSKSICPKAANKLMVKLTPAIKVFYFLNLSSQILNEIHCRCRESIFENF